MSTPPNQPTPPTPPNPSPETPGQAADQVVADAQSDIAATQAAVTGTIDPAIAQARAEYDTLEPAAQARLHSLLNDLETLYSVSLPAIHSLFGAK